MKEIYNPAYYGKKIEEVIYDARRNGIMLGATVDKQGKVKLHIENTSWTCDPKYVSFEAIPNGYCYDVELPNITDDVVEKEEKKYEIHVENYYKESLQMMITLLKNAGVEIVSYEDDGVIDNEIVVKYAGDDFREIMEEIEETQIAGCHVHDWVQVR